MTTHRLSNRPRYLLTLLLAVSVLLCACGQRGDLILPRDEPTPDSEQQDA